jgi:hypothetical protein
LERLAATEWLKLARIDPAILLGLAGRYRSALLV